MFKKLSAFILSLSACTLLVAVPVFAQTKTVNTLLDDAKKNITAVDTTGKESLETRIGRYIGVTLSLVATILVILIIYAGFLWFTAGGNADQVQKAKDIIKNCVIGVVIITAAYVITNFVITNLGSAK